MPQVKQASTHFGGKPYTMRITVNGEGIFTAKLPLYSHAALGQDRVLGKTLEECERLWKRCREEYGKLLSSERLVIRYCFKIQDKEKLYTDTDGRNDLSFGIGKGVQFGVGNYFETTHKNSDGEELRKSYSDTNQLGEELLQPYPIGYQFHNFSYGLSGSDSDIKTLEWSEQSERWFVSLCMAMDGLIRKLRDLDEDQQRLLEAVSNVRLIAFQKGSDDGHTLPD